MQTTKSPMNKKATNIVTIVFIDEGNDELMLELSSAGNEIEDSYDGARSVMRQTFKITTVLVKKDPKISWAKTLENSIRKEVKEAKWEKEDAFVLFEHELAAPMMSFLDYLTKDLANLDEHSQAVRINTVTRDTMSLEATMELIELADLPDDFIYH